MDIPLLLGLAAAASAPTFLVIRALRRAGTRFDEIMLEELGPDTGRPAAVLSVPRDRSAA
ncbi:hypothetical protein [Umezawaea sp. Da 62-37]|uniref:hypothetical protein n=1 Tax=Umezawaea sp. Da 62-37 TaxID=3075927 RepID=UPI0028F6DF9A|nr:hypothetical protein [Umezawaea sp. Da 62-37]WNV87957.1 hypothetical protein RM788_06625 [Umezawaea sp. Da 62-37]